MNILEISVLNPAIVTVGGFRPEPNVQERTWGEFLPLESYFPEVIFLNSSNVGSPSLKRNGNNLPGKNGIDYVYSPVSSTQKQFEFLVRSTTSESEARETVKRFVKWLYSLGEFRISFNNESQYRRMIYTSGSDYQMLNGVYGFDANFTITLTCMDSLSYSKEYVDLPFEMDGNVRFNLATNHNTVDYTPIIMEHVIDSGTPETISAYRALAEISVDGINKPCVYFDLFTTANQIITPFTIFLNGETSELYILKDGIKYNFLNRISTDTSPLSDGRQGNYIPTSFPYLMATNTYYAYSFDMISGTRDNPRFYYRPRVLAYD